MYSYIVKMIKLVLLLITFSMDAFGSSQFTPCNREDEACLVALVQAMYATALDSSHSSNLDPMFQERIYADLETLKFTLKNTTIEGYRKCEAKDVKISSDRTSLTLAMFCPEFHINGHYEVNGTIATVPFNGNGELTLTATDYDITVHAILKTIEDHDQTYLKITNFDEESELKGKLDFKFDNLFNGNEKLSEAMHTFLQTNQKWVVPLLQRPILNENIQKVIVAFNKVFESIPVNGLLM